MANAYTPSNSAPSQPPLGNTGELTGGVGTPPIASQIPTSLSPSTIKTPIRPMLARLPQFSEQDRELNSFHRCTSKEDIRIDLPS
jgi:hypothetical protein